MTPLFRTVVPVRPVGVPITHKSTILSVGSCFAETMGARLKTYRFTCTDNPTGILFNPVSIADLLERLARKEFCQCDDLFLHRGPVEKFQPPLLFCRRRPRCGARRDE
jgi:hypothetical protein